MFSIRISLYPPFLNVKELYSKKNLANSALSNSGTSPRLSTYNPKVLGSFPVISSVVVSFLSMGSFAQAASIQSMINSAQSGATITIAAGTYNENLVIGKPLTINGAGIGKTIINGRANGPVVDVSARANLSLSGMTLTNGRSNLGGGIYNDGATITLTNVYVYNNTAGAQGGGIFNAGRLNLNNGSSVSNNTALGHGGGGGIYNYDKPSSLFLNAGSLVANNKATNGGGIKVDSGTITMEGGVVSGNSANLPDSDNWGGGIYNDAGTLTINSGVITNNTALMGGGGVCNDYYANMVMNGGAITDNATSGKNSSWGRGGGVYSDQINKITLNGGVITGNTAVLGGGVWIDTDSTLVIQNGSSIAHNTAGQGGGIYAAPGSSVSLVKGYVSYNKALNQKGGGIFNRTTINLVAGSIDNNTATADGAGVYNYKPGVLTGNTNLISNNFIQ